MKHEEIQNIKNRNLICLDFDDAIIEYHRRGDGNWIMNTEKEITEILKRNVENIKSFCKEFNFEVFIISSWAPLINDDLTANYLDNIQAKWWNIIKTLPIIGKDPFRDRELAMEVLLDNGNKIICIDDWDLSSHFEWVGDKFIMINVINGLGWHRFENLKTKLRKE